jgi:hypothetical protein
MRHTYSKKRSAFEDERKLRRDILPGLGHHRASVIMKPDIVRLLDRIVDRGAGIAANRTLALVRKLCNWAIGEGYVSTNLATGIAILAKEETRARVLADVVIAAFWRALDAIGVEAVAADASWQQLLLAARIREITGMTRHELDLNATAPTSGRAEASGQGGA